MLWEKEERTMLASLRQRMVDGTFRHPFTMMVSGASETGKSTFVSHLLRNRKHVIDLGGDETTSIRNNDGVKARNDLPDFDYVYIIIGTNAQENQIFNNLALDLINEGLPTVEIWEVNNMFDTKKKLKEDFPKRLESSLSKLYNEGKRGCLILDDLMQEMGDNDFLTSAFTRMSTHFNLSVIYITQNLFFKGQKASNSTTVYRNCKHLVLFESRNDKTVLSFLAQKIGHGKAMRAFLEAALENFRYIIINFDLKRDKRLQFTTDIFREDKLFNPVLTDPIPFQTVLTPQF